MVGAVTPVLSELDGIFEVEVEEEQRTALKDSPRWKSSSLLSFLSLFFLKRPQIWALY